MKILGIIEMEQKQEKLPNQYMLYVNKKPLIFHTLDLAQHFCDKIVIKTSNEDYKRIILTDYKNINIDNVIDERKYDLVINFNPLYPLIEKKTIQYLINKSQTNNKVILKEFNKQDVFNYYLINKNINSNEKFIYTLDERESLSAKSQTSLTNIIGNIYFNYQLREKNLKEKYKKDISSVHINQDNLFIGDSRIQGLVLYDYNILCFPGITLNTLVNNISFLGSKKYNNIIISLGINDIITKYDKKDIKNSFKKLNTIISYKNMYIVEIIYPLYSFSVDNSELDEINIFLNEFCINNDIKLIKVNNILCDNNQLKYKYSEDGIHLNKKGKIKLQEVIINKLKRDKR